MDCLLNGGGGKAILKQKVENFKIPEGGVETKHAGVPEAGRVPPHTPRGPALLRGSRPPLGSGRAGPHVGSLGSPVRVPAGGRAARFRTCGAAGFGTRLCGRAVRTSPSRPHVTREENAGRPTAGVIPAAAAGRMPLPGPRNAQLFGRGSKPFLP